MIDRISERPPQRDLSVCAVVAIGISNGTCASNGRYWRKADFGWSVAKKLSCAAKASHMRKCVADGVGS